MWLQALRWAYAGPNPIVATTWGFFVLGVLPGLFTAFVVLSEDVAEWEGEDLMKMQGLNGSEKVWQKRSSIDVLSDDWEEGVHDRVLDFERECQLEVAAYDDGEDVETPRMLLSRKNKYHHLQEEVQLADFKSPQVDLGESTEGHVLQRHIGSNEEYGPAIDPAASIIEGTEMIVVSQNTFKPSESRWEREAVHGDDVSHWLKKADDESVFDGKVCDGDISLASWEDEIICKRWGEGEEVPWVNELGGLKSSCDSEMNMYRKRGLKWTRSGCSRTFQMGVGLGSLLFLTHWLFTSANTFSRWSGASVTWGWLSISSLALGIVVAAEVARHHLPKQVQALVAWLCVAAGAVLLFQGVTPAVIGGAFLSVAVPSLWIMMPRNIFGIYPGTGIAIAIVVYLLLMVWSTALFAFQSLPGIGDILRGTKAYLLFCTVIGIGIGLGRGPDVSPQEKWEFGERMGAWRTGALTWGSGVPSRQVFLLLSFSGFKI